MDGDDMTGDINPEGKSLPSLNGTENDCPHPAPNQADRDRYQTFISIVFGVFLSAWVTQVSQFPNIDSYISHALPMAQGAAMFVILACLWWWYAAFLASVNPANGFLMYLYDFLTLAAFGVAFQAWARGADGKAAEVRAYFFPAAVFIGSLCMFVRFLLAHLALKNATRCRHRCALWIAVVVLLFFMVGTLGAVVWGGSGGPGHRTGSVEHLTEVAIRMARMTLVLLSLGVIATVVGAWVVERGLRWHRAICPSQGADCR